MNNPPKQSRKRSSEQGDQKWQQNEQEHEFELWDVFLWRKTKWMGAGISGGAHMGPTRQGGTPRGNGRALHPRGQVLAPPDVFSVPKILKYSINIILKLQGIWSTFIFEIFFNARIIQKIDG